MSIQVGKSLLEIADVNIKCNEVVGGVGSQLYPEGVDEQPMKHLLLKPLSHFNYESIIPGSPQQKRYVLNINVLTKVTHLPDPVHAISLRTAGKTAMLFINYKTQGDDGAGTADSETTYKNYRYRIQFKHESTYLVKGKELVVITASGDPEEGSASKIIVEDEDEI